MINLSSIANSLRLNAKENSATLLSLGAGLGVISTAYLTAKAAMKSARMIDHAEAEHGTNPDPKERFKERTQLVWKEYIPPAIVGASTIACIVGSNRVSSNKAVAAQTALAVTQSAYSEYRDRVIEELGPQGHRKDDTIRAKIAQDRVDKTDPTNSEVLLVGDGEVLCFEMWTSRYFKSDMESIKKAVNEINARMLKHDYATMDDFYYLIGLEPTQISNNNGWKVDKLLEVYFASVFKNGKPAMSIEYNYVTAL